MDGQINPKSLKFSKNKFGKPEVIWPCDTSYENKWKPPTLCFNLAHTSSLICCGVTTKSLVGIDVEEKSRRMRTNILAFAKRYFSPPEIAWLETCKDPEEQRQKFIQLWTLKEAYVKALGRGISGAPLKDFAIHIEHLPVTQRCIGQYENPTNSHYASVCLEQDEKHLHEDNISRMNFPGLKMHIWKTVPLVKDESMSVKEAVIASTNSFPKPNHLGDETLRCLDTCVAIGGYVTVHRLLLLFTFVETGMKIASPLDTYLSCIIWYF